MNKISFTLLCLISLSACTPKANQENFTKGMNDYLAKRGDLCLAKNNWPIDVSAEDVAIGTRNALQMPVLQKLGLVSATTLIVENKIDKKVVKNPLIRYQLTEQGKKYYLMRESSSTAADDSKIEHQGDLCVAKLSLDKVVKWEPASNVGANKQMVVSYTYSIVPAPWLQNADAKRVFPMVDRVVQGAHVAQLQETFVLMPDGWVAKELIK